MELAENANEPHSPNHILRLVYILVFDTGQLNCQCEKWSHKIPTDKTWVNFKTHFAQAHKMMRASQATAENTGFGSVNTIREETVTQLENLAENTATNRNIVQSLTSTKTKLEAELVTSNLTLAVAVTLRT